MLRIFKPAAPNAIRQNCNRPEACRELFLMRSSAKVRVSSSCASSSTSRPLTTAPTGLIKSWQIREHNKAERSSASGVTVPDMVVRSPVIRPLRDSEGWRDISDSTIVPMLSM